MENTKDKLMRILAETLDGVVDRYRRSGAPVAVYKVDDRVIARVASCEFHVGIEMSNGVCNGLRIESIPPVSGLTDFIEIDNIKDQAILEKVRRSYYHYSGCLVRWGIHPFCNVDE